MSEELFKKHLGKPIEVEIAGDKFEFKPLTVLEARNLMTASILSNTAKNQKDIERGIELMFDVAKSVIKRSYPELKDETVEDFIANNMTDVFKVLPMLAGLPNIEEEAKKLFEK